jgi:hypothetical protein
MSDSRLALVIGLFVVPAVLLWLGHRLRRQTPARRRIFWGATVGYGLGMVATLIAIHYPPVRWAGADWRTAVVHWGMLVGAVLGGAAGRLMLRRPLKAAGNSRRRTT